MIKRRVDARGVEGVVVGGSDSNVGRVGDVDQMHGVVISRQCLGIGHVVKSCCLHWIRATGVKIVRVRNYVEE